MLAGDNEILHAPTDPYEIELAFYKAGRPIPLAVEESTENKDIVNILQEILEEDCTDDVNKNEV